jgi:hypothetical protein
MTRAIPLLAAAAALIGAILEWRRDEQQRAVQQQKIDSLEQQVSELQSWRDRMGRSM